MTKKQIILISTLSVLTAIVLVLTILFAAVFCLRHVEVAFISEQDKQEMLSLYEDFNDQTIIDLANLNVGKSIFTQNTQQAQDNIESYKNNPYIKVTRITAKNINTFQIRLAVRHEMFSYNYLSKYYVLDDQLKVLRVETEKPEGLIEINPTQTNEVSKIETVTNILNVTNETDVCNFLARGYYQSIFTNLYSSMYSTVVIEDGETANYVDYKNINSVIKDVSFTMGYSYEKLILNVTLPQANFTIEIGKPNSNLQHKINSCFSLANNLIKEGKSIQTIRYYFNGNGGDVLDYVETT